MRRLFTRFRHSIASLGRRVWAGILHPYFSYALFALLFLINFTAFIYFSLDYDPPYLAKDQILSRTHFFQSLFAVSSFVSLAILYWSHFVFVLRLAMREFALQIRIFQDTNEKAEESLYFYNLLTPFLKAQLHVSCWDTAVPFRRPRLEDRARVTILRDLDRHLESIRRRLYIRRGAFPSLAFVFPLAIGMPTIIENGSPFSSPDFVDFIVEVMTSALIVLITTELMLLLNFQKEKHPLKQALLTTLALDILSFGFLISFLSSGVIRRMKEVLFQPSSPLLANGSYELHANEFLLGAMIVLWASLTIVSLTVIVFVDDAEYRYSEIQSVLARRANEFDIEIY